MLIHGNLSTGRFYEHLFEGAPDRYRFVAPDMRSFGDSESLPIDATRGLRDWADDTQALLEREEMLLTEVLKSVTGDDGYPGDSRPSENWPGVAPGMRGILNALSGQYCNWAGIVDLDPKPPILWTQGSDDILVADGSPWEMGTLGRAGAIPDWPGEEVFPPQPMVSQIRAVLERYADAGGRVESETFEGSGHFPPIDAAERWRTTFFGFLDSVH